MISNEEDVRTKVIIPWLESHGFSKEQLSVEESFNIHLGRNAYRIDSHNNLKEAPENAKPRIDVLVKDLSGKNLFVIEVKGPEVPLSDSSYRQSISYGRLLDSGGIAPYVVTTNGKNTKVYFTLTGEEVTEESIKLKGFDFDFNSIRDDIQLKNDALLQLITLSDKNLLKFTELQVVERMELLYSDSILSWEKYIPQLYVKREDEELEFRKHIDSGKKVILVTAPPQVGKTNFLCHMARTMLGEGHSCLFYPSIGMSDSLINSIASDFCWQGIENNSPITFIRNNIQRITQNQKITIFLDGLNEISSDLIKKIGEDASRLHNLSITFVISCTWSAIRRVLNDNNIAHYFLKHLNIDRGLLERMDVESNIEFKEDTPIIELKKFNQIESKLAFQRYSSEYNAQNMSFKHEYAHPYSLRLAMQHYQKTGNENDLSLPELLKLKIQDKAERCLIFDHQTIFPTLANIVEKMIVNEASYVDVSFIRELNLLKNNHYNKLFDSGILAQYFNNKAEPQIIFYDEMERDFIAAIYSMKLDEIDEGEIFEVLERFYQFYVTSSAIRWFCRVSESFCEKCFNSFNLNNSDLCAFVISAIRKNTEFSISDEQYFKLFDESLSFSSPRLIAELLHWGFELDIEFNDLIEALDETDQEVFMQGLLSINAEVAELDGYMHSIIERLTFSHYMAVRNDEDEHSAITSILYEIASSTSNQFSFLAAKFLAYINPKFFVQIFRKGNITKQENINDIANLIMGNLNSQYFGDMCPGILYSIEDSEAALGYFEELKELCPFMFRSTDQDVLEDFKHLLFKLNWNNQPIFENSELQNEATTVENKEQLTFEF